MARRLLGMAVVLLALGCSDSSVHTSTDETAKIFNKDERYYAQPKKWETFAYPVEKIEIRRAEKAPRNGLEEMVDNQTGEKVYVSPMAAIGKGDIAEATIKIPDISPWPVSLILKFTESGQKKMTEISTNYQGRPLGIFVDGKL